jgi:hypothetical protein
VRRPGGAAIVVAAIGAVALVLGGCVSAPREPFTAAEQAGASPRGFADVRYAEDAPDLTKLLKAALRPNGEGEVDALALSGGGANGAFGAGVLYGWSRSGRRPQFEVVTGVSTGALTAPLAFLGPSWDETLRYAYTGPHVVHLLRGRGLLSLFTPGFYRNQPLKDLVRGYVTDALMRAVAAEHARGRRLLVATTNLDTEQLIIWDMGAIASHGGKAARDLFTQVLVASASMPGVFPPSLIGVEAPSRRFTEMHVDGQTLSPFFAFPPALLLANDGPGETSRIRFYVIINGQTDNRFAVTPTATLPILARSFDVASKASVRSALITMAEFCRVQGCAVRVAAMPLTQKDDALDFSTGHVRSLFDAGDAASAAGQAWREVTAPSP